MTRADTIRQLLESYQTYFDITKYEDKDFPLVARCDFFEDSKKYVLSKKAELWSIHCEEFLYLFEMPTLTSEIFNRCKDYVIEDAQARMHIGPTHMYSYMTAIFVCDTCDLEAMKLIRKSNYYKSFKFSLHGWAEYHNAVYICQGDKILSNRAGKSTAKILKRVLIHK